MARRGRILPQEWDCLWASAEPSLCPRSLTGLPQSHEDAFNIARDGPGQLAHLPASSELGSGAQLSLPLHCCRAPHSSLYPQLLQFPHGRAILTCPPHCHVGCSCSISLIFTPQALPSAPCSEGLLLGAHQKMVQTLEFSPHSPSSPKPDITLGQCTS